MGGDFRKLDPALADWLEACDELLAAQDVALHERPLRAALLLVRHAVVKVNEHGTEETIDEHVGLGDVIEKRWFGSLVRMSEGWYAKTVGPAALRPPESSAAGVVMHRGAIQLIKIPLVLTELAEVAHRKWIAFPDQVADAEDVLGWVVPALDRNHIRAEELVALSAKIRGVAGSIRFIASRARNASEGSEEQAGLLAGGFRNLEAFAQLAVIGDRAERQKAWWELQMASESFLKALCLQKGRPGGYRKTHSLPDLVGDAEQCGIEFDVARLSDWPSQNEVSEFRYATGRRATSTELLFAYELTLDLCLAAVSALDVRLDTGKARFLIQPLPWRLREVENRE